MKGFSTRIVARTAVVSLTIACGDASGPPANPPANILAVSGDAQAGVQVGTKLPLPLTAKVVDADGNPVARTTVTWNTNTGTLSAATSVTDAKGLTSVEWTLGTTSGQQT